EENTRLSYIGLKSIRLTILNGSYTIIIGLLPTIIGLFLASGLYFYSMPLILSFTQFASITNIQMNNWLVICAIIIIYFTYFLTLNKRIKINRKRVKIKSQKYNKSSSIEKEYSLRSITMNKKKYISIIISLTLTLSIFALITITTLSLDPIKHAQNNNIYDVQIKGLILNNRQDTNPIEVPSFLENDSTISFETNHLLYQDTETGLQSYNNIKIDKKIQAAFLPYQISEDKDQYLSNIGGLGIDYFKYISNKYKIEGSPYANDGLMYYRAAKTIDNINVGDKITLQIEINGKYQIINTIVETIITNKNNNESNYDSNLAIFNFSAERFVELFGNNHVNMIGLSSSDKDELHRVQDLISINEQYDVQTYESYQEIIESFRMFLVSFGIIGALLLFINSILNIACTQVSNCISRNKELATLEAIGCSKKRII
ncbi:MAG: hypothetical protein ACRCTA_00090, partial [Bacilli bacterium]